MSFPSHSSSYQPNIFDVTNSRFHIPTDVLFTRLALVRPLTSLDEALKEKINTPMYVPILLRSPINGPVLPLTHRRTRQLYLRFGPSTLLNCPFCHSTDPNSYLLYHLPSNIVLLHLLHLLLLGLATSSPISGRSANILRTKLAISALALAAIDIYLTSTYTPLIPNPNSPSPPLSIYWTALTLRPLSICIHDVLAAAIIYISATNRLPFLFATSANNPESQRSRQIHLLTQSSVALQTALAKLRAFAVAKSAVVRDMNTSGLKERDDEYWRAVVGMEGLRGDSDGNGMGVGVWDDEEVMEAVARVINKGRDGSGGGVDVESVRREAGMFVDSVTRGLEVEGNDEGENRVAL